MKPKRFNTEKDFHQGTAVENAPLVGGEFIVEGAKEGELAQGQTVEVKSDTHLEDDLGTGEHVIVRMYQFAVNPEAFRQHIPTASELFESHRKGIAAMLWQDGLTPIVEQDPRVVFAKDKESYMIFVTARPSVGQTVLEKSFTLSELVPKPNATSRHPN